MHVANSNFIINVYQAFFSLFLYNQVVYKDHQTLSYTYFELLVK